MDIDSQEVLKAHRSIILRKTQLNILYQAFYKQLLREFDSKQKVVEIGSGGGFVKKLRPNTITSDVIKAQGIDSVFKAEKIPYKDHSIDGFIMLNVFHHIKDPQKALKEMSRTLKPGGKIVMIEPWNSLWGRFIYTHFHHENFDIQSPSWKIKGKKRMTDANGANLWIIFVRDRERFNMLFPEFTFIKLKTHTPFSYLLSGGLSRPAIIPSFLMAIFIKTERKLLKHFSFLSMFVTICIQKNKI